MKIFDCFKFFNEVELLDLRLMVLNDLVDYFVIVESNKTHTGKSKEFIFEENKDMFSDYMHKIIYVKVEDLPDYSRDDIWIAENYQRNCISRGLTKASVGDKIIVSDADEIPNPYTIEKFTGTNDPVTMIQHLFYYYVDCLQGTPWTGSIMATQGNYLSPQWLRNIARSETCYSVPNGGWHYSFMGGPERIRNKVENIAESHIIIDKVGTPDEIRGKMLSQKDLWGRTEQPFQKRIVDINANGMAPACIHEFIHRYPDFFYGELNE